MNTRIGQLVVWLFGFSFWCQGQIHLTRSAHVKFYSHAPLEDIEAHSYQMSIALNTQTGEVVAKVLIRTFQFEKALMQEHFNENYMESDKYPEATFKGKIQNWSPELLKDGVEQKVNVTGELTIHGVTRNVTLPGTIRYHKEENAIRVFSEFYVVLKEYAISIPKAVVKNIAEKVLVTVDGTLKPYK